MPDKPTKAELMLAEQFELALPGLPGAAPAIKARRRAAFERFRSEGLPSRRNEAWHYTDLRARLNEPAMPMLRVVPTSEDAAEPVQDDPFASALPLHVTFGDGAIVLGGTLPAGVEIIGMRDALLTNHPLLARMGEAMPDADTPIAALNVAFLNAGLVLHLKRGVKLETPIRLCARFTMDIPRAVFSRVLVVAEEDSAVTVITSQLGPNSVAYQANLVAEVIMADRARVDLVRVNLAGEQALTLGATGVKAGAGCTYNQFHFAAGGDLMRNEIHLRSVGEGANIQLSGASMLRRRQHSDMTLVVRHEAPGCASRELFRTVVDGEATGVFQGRIVVRREAQQTDGRMASNAILLSDKATMNNKPELEIFADNVQCAHGATCGALDEDLLFYLQSRGLPKAEAEALMIQAFCGEAIETVAHQGVRDVLNGLVADWLKGRRS